MSADEIAAFLEHIDDRRMELASRLARRKPHLGEHELNDAVQDAIQQSLFERMLHERGIGHQGGRPPDGLPAAALPVDVLGHVHEHCLGRPIRLSAAGRVHIADKTDGKKAKGVYYTPAHIVAHIVQHTVGQLLRSRRTPSLRVVDPSCGAGSFLIGAYRRLLDWHQQANGCQLTAAERVHILLDCIHGVDNDRRAVEAARRSLLLIALEGHRDEPPRNLLSSLAGNIKVGNAVIGPDFESGKEAHAFDWPTEFAPILRAGGFDAVIGNPPWGQKGIIKDARMKNYLQQRYPSSRGIHDLFRPFVELGITLTADHGMFGMVLPDIVLLKNYAETRRYLLDHLTLQAIDWWGEAFAGAVIDTATIIGQRAPAPARHRVAVAIHDIQATRRQKILQADFWANPRHVFNLHLTAQVRRTLQRLAAFPPLGDYFEIHEGIHSGNMRDELFVPKRTDRSCRELYFGRGEIRPYSLNWAGGHVRLSAMLHIKSRERYANLGKTEWHEQPKVLVRRTGDHVLAAVDRQGRYASNNFFLVFPSRKCALDLDGLCALLNSRFMTWYFRTMEPRQGRAFAELKIKHMRTFPLPLRDGAGCRQLNELGRRRARAADSQPAAETFDQRIDRLVCRLFEMTKKEIDSGELGAGNLQSGERRGRQTRAEREGKVKSRERS